MSIEISKSNKRYVYSTIKLEQANLPVDSTKG